MAAKRPSAGKRPSIDLSGLELIAQLDAVQKQIEAAREVAVSDIEAALFAPFWDEMHEDGVHELRSVDAVDGEASGVISFNRKKSNVALKPPEIKKLSAAKIALPAPSGPRFAINGEYADNERILLKLADLIEKAILEGVDLPEDFIVSCDQKITVTEQTVMDVLSKDYQTAYGLLPAIGKVSISKTVLPDKMTIDKAIKAITPKLKEVAAA